MTDHDPDDRVLPPEREAQLRRLLADARHTDPIPKTVLARLDRVLADLAGEPARAADVVRLADRRRRVATMLVAAAASVVAVAGIGAVLSGTGDGGADTATSSEAEDGEAPGALTDEDTASGAESGARGGAASDLSRKRLPYSLDSQSFAEDANTLQLEALSGAFDGADDGEEQAAPEPSSGNLDRVKNRAVCEPGAWGGGSYVAVLYDGAEGWVVLRRPQGETQIADLFLCGSESVIRSVTLPYP